MSAADVDDVCQPAVEGAAETVTIDGMLKKYCGEFGAWQLKNFCVCNLSYMLEALHTMVMIFADRQPEWRCIDEGGCDEAAENVCGLKPGSWEWVAGRRSSTVAEWDLVCGNKYKVGLAQAIFFLGCMLGAVIFGHLSNRFGRKRSLVVVCISSAIFGCLTALSPSYWFYITLRFLTGVSSVSYSLCAFVLSTEPIGLANRGPVGMCVFYFFAAGIALTSAIAFISHSWRKLYIISSIPSFFYLALIFPFISESPRWYLVQRDPDKAIKVMASIAKSNGKHIPNGVILSLDRESNKEIDGSIVDILQSPIARTRLLLGVVINFMNSLVYFGLNLNVANLSTNLYVSVLLNGIVQVPALLITSILLGKLGRKGVGIGTFWLSGGFCLIGSLMRSDNGKWKKVVKMVCGLLGLSGMAGNYNLLCLYYTELFPTEVRNIAIGYTSQGIQIGAILAPFVVVLGSGLAFMVFAVCGVVGGILVFFLPETLNKPLDDTLAGMEAAQNHLAK